MNKLRLFVTLMIGGLCGAKIWEARLPKEIQECYNKVQDADTSTYVGSTFSWVCESMINSQISKPVQLDAQKISYYKHLLERCISRNKTDGGATVPRHKRKAGPGPCEREEYRMMSDEKRTRFHNAVNGLKRDTSVRPNKYDAIALLHVKGLYSAHAGPGFCGWHRLYINMFEAGLQEVDPSVCLPYWDSSLDSELDDPTLSNIWTPAFMGTPNGPVEDGPFANWRTPNGAQLIRNVGADGELITTTIIEDILSRRRYEDITDSLRVRPRYDLEFHHGSCHVFVGGTMSQLDTAAFDPIFFLLHAYIDYIWELFRTKLRDIGRNPELYPDTVSRNSRHHSSAATGIGNMLQADAYRDAISDIFEYQPAPTCSSRSPQCGSRYLTCVERIGRCVPTTAGTDMSSPTITQRRSKRSEVVPGAQLSDPTTTQSQEAPLSDHTTTQSSVVSGAPLPGGAPSDTRCLKSEKFYGQAIQNDFCSDHTCDTNEWVMIPVKIITVRPPKFKHYKSYPVHKGLIDSHEDIYSPRAYNQTNRNITQPLSIPKTFKRCKRDYSVGEVLLSSRGINYHGFYEEAAIVDQRLAASISLGFVAVKKPVGARVSKALIRAHDSCGRVCQAICKNPLTGKYKKCKGAIAVSAEKPAMYGTSYDEAVMKVFDYDDDSHLPQFKTNNFFISFYCNHKSKFPYTNYSSDGVPRPAEAENLPTVVPPSNTECQVTPRCILDIPCVSTEHQCSLHDEKHICRGSCREYAVCMYGNFFLRICPEGHSFDNVNKICVPGGCQ